MLYPQNGDRIVAIDSVTSLSHYVYWHCDVHGSMVAYVVGVVKVATAAAVCDDVWT